MVRGRNGPSVSKHVTSVVSVHSAPSRPSTWIPNKPVTQQRVTPTQIAVAAYHWFTWLLITGLVFLQFLTIVWNTTSTTEHVVYGQSPLLGSYEIPGANDEPYSDRSILCVQQGRTYAPLNMNNVLELGSTKIVDTTGTAQSGYRLVNRTGLIISADTISFYESMCTQIAMTLDMIMSTCTSLGYNVTTQRSGLDIVNGVDSATTFHVPRALPVVILPFLDNAIDMRVAVPGVDGSACMFRLFGKYIDPHLSAALLDAVNRTVREARTIEWLNAPGGTWRNGWYEDPSGSKWYSDVIGTDPTSGFDILQQRFDMHTGDKLNCTDMTKCLIAGSSGNDAKFHATITEVSMTSIAIANGARFGLFLYDGVLMYIITSEYDWQTLLSNATVGYLLTRWLFVQFALAYAYASGVSDWHSAGIGCLANAKDLRVLSIMLMPRLRQVLLAFWTVGCEFEGVQVYFVRAWFVIYPSIVELMFFYYSLLNAIAKISGRRVSDALFGVSVAALCLLHWMRHAIANATSLGFTGRISSLLSQNEIDALSLVDMLTPHTALRVNGDAKIIFYTKIAVLALSLVPLLLPSQRRKLSRSTTVPSGIKFIGDAEDKLAVRLACSGGFGRHTQHPSTTENGSRTSGRMELSSYELVRLGYVVFGDKFVVSLDDWELLTLVAPLRAVAHLWNHRVLAFSLEYSKSGAVTLSASPKLFRIDDPELQQIRWWDIRSRAIA